MPIDRKYRETWNRRGKHRGHQIWTREGKGEIHGTIVGIHISSCTGCMKCVAVCPVRVFEKDDWNCETIVDPVREDECILCLACEFACPVDAISIQTAGGSEDTLDALLS